MNIMNYRHDLRASLVAFLVALPLCLGISLASNAPMSSGLIAGIIGGIVVGILSGSHVSISGPAAGLTVIVISALSELGSSEVFAVSVVLAGFFQIIFSFLNGGIIGNYFPTSVIKGMLASIGLVLILKQLPHAVGYDVDFIGDESFIQKDGQNTFSEIFMAIKYTHWGSLIIFITSFFTMITFDKLSKSQKTFLQAIPGALVAVIFSVILNKIFSSFPDLLISEKNLVQLPYMSGIKEFVDGLIHPDWSQLNNPRVISHGMIIALVASLQSLLSIEASDKLDTNSRVTSKNRELRAQGVGNIVSGLLGGLPIASVIIRTTANITSGAKTKLSTVFHGVWLFICVVSIPQFINLIPLSCLAAILIFVGHKLINMTLIKEMFQKGQNQFIPFVVTIFSILFTDLLIGIMIGLLVGFFFVIKSSIHKSIVMVHDDNQYLIRFHKDVSFLQKTLLLDMFDQIPPNSVVYMDGSNGVFIDDDIALVVEEYQKRAVLSNIRVELKKSTLALSPLFKEETNG